MLAIYFLFLTPQVNSLADYGFGRLEVVSDLLPEQCFAQEQNYVKEDEIHGLPRCAPFDNVIGEICTNYHNPELYSDLVYKPKCMETGQFDAKQCKGERTTGRCFCFDANGERIFGQQWWNQADAMTCACSRKKADMADSIYYNSLHCDSMGNYESLQCDILSEQCWCADEKTGDLKFTVVPAKAMSKLPCYNSLLVGSSYLRQCENKKYAEDTITHKLRLHGTRVHFGEFLCDDDGSYGAYSIIDGSAYCTWRDNSKIGSWQSGSNHTGINCNCAKDTKIFTLAGKRQQQKCTSNGNYEEFQRSSINTYCVDMDGFRKSPSGTAVEDASFCANYAAYH